MSRPRGENILRGLGWSVVLTLPFWLVLGGACWRAWQR
jgi:hypothetical protein